MNTSGRFVPRSCSTSSSSFYGYGGRSPVEFLASEELSGEPLDVPRSFGDSISVIVRFRPMNDYEYQRGDEITWYPDGDKIVRSEYNPATTYAFGTVFAYGVTSSGKTHTMHGDQSSLGIIPLAIKDVFSIIQDIIDSKTEVLASCVLSRGLQWGWMTMSEEMDLLVEQVKMLAGDIAFSTSTLKRMLEQSVNDLDALKTQVQVP
ncbi:hypothetical protein Ancab_002122 [Ancistrocladus abbreviatus]